MILIAKPHKFGSVSTGADDLTDLTSAADVPLLQGIDNLPFNNPDAAAGNPSTYPDFRGGHPQGAIRSESRSGGGAVHPTGRTTAPMGRPFSAGPNTVRTEPMSIKK